ncbi:MAG TPA: hypothetical protein PLJ47_00160 [Candidatus Hydrogenedentes bacterium]|nr:hypothetical protein [Candidatus Hydrogenedentota bacterium]HRK32975.1 hypothetical protein [Candidatus Hydrogenedentota bacterium]
MKLIRFKFGLRKYGLYILSYLSPLFVLGLAYLSTESNPSLAIASVPIAKVPTNRIPVVSRLERLNINGDSRKHVVNKIAGYQSAYSENPNSEDAPAYLMAIGNLRLEILSDYSGALEAFELIISSYQEAPQRSTAYYQALACYMRLEDETGARSLLRRMGNEFPAGSEEREFADETLADGIHSALD